MKTSLTARGFAFAGGLVISLTLTACESFHPMPQELSAGQRLSDRRAEKTNVSFDSGRRLAEERRKADPIGPIAFEISAITAGDLLARRSDLTGGDPAILIGGTDDQFFFFEPK